MYLLLDVVFVAALDLPGLNARLLLRNLLDVHGTLLTQAMTSSGRGMACAVVIDTYEEQLHMFAAVSPQTQYNTIQYNT